MKRKLIIIGVSIAVLFGGFTLSNILKESKKPPLKNKGVFTATVFAETIKNSTIPLDFTATGSLEAKNRVEIYAEVQGVMISPIGSFKEGASYKKGKPLVAIESDVYRASLMSQKSSLQNLVTSALADLRLDYASSFDKWNDFLKQIDVNNPLPPLPEYESNKEKMFITGRNIYSTYYNVRNMELTLAKYNITAPFDGVLVEALVTPGSLIRPGQKLGEFIQPTVFEIEAPVSASMIGFLKIGQKVTVTSTNNDSKKWIGEIVRINRLVNSETQTTNVYVQVKGDGLEEGMYVKTNIMATEVENAYELSRSVIFDKNQVFVVEDSILVQKTIEPLFYKEKSVVISGLKDGEHVLSKLPTGAYPGMKVTIYTEQ
ncbi:efflux RND transporter periplasmic adaptor subunit [Cyclobacterium marinum]|uniref:Efflux transporter, RND family, MFP subunit n=2 Tax=Cyclobacterium marinum TaxID=104 RepID=G0J3J4_CYCMS|nr:HlyD family efflux transporter periplasmic adaptor subunit [Cyclobacterium marinum]AEL24633.1 efflux transporter, RND family, MFP subunit [Cyclobacterium marinum DSM 745]MBI0399287.1 HlyD family efflux transporter periplasmic adaptor subunit [Cyclobacterium marinum]|tara:strand:- start:231 stop:1349 length:1119 start_codon:yes stop_codon:yes gene_type:complete